MARRRLKGAVLSIDIDGEEYNLDTTSVEITNEEADEDVITFADLAEGEIRDWFLDIVAIQSTEAEALWSFNWDHSGDTVSVTVAPHGNASASGQRPHFICAEVEVGPPPTLGGEAGRENTWTYESQWKIVSGKPVKDTGNGGGGGGGGGGGD